MSVLGSWLLALVVTTADAGHPGQAAQQRVLVLDLQPSGAPPDLARNLSEIVVEATRRALPDGSVLGQSEINSMLALEKQRDLTGCASDVTCLAEIGGALGAGRLIVGSIGKVGTLYLLTLKLLDAEHARTLQHVSAEVEARPELLVEATRQWTARLWDPKAVTGVGIVEVEGTGAVSVDGQKRGDAPVRVVLPPGSHRIDWLRGAPAEVAASRMVKVEAYATASVDDVVTATGEPVAAPPPPVDVARVAVRVGYAFPVNGMHGHGVSYGIKSTSINGGEDVAYDPQSSNPDPASMNIGSASGVDFEAAVRLRGEHTLVLAITWARGQLEADQIDVFGTSTGGVSSVNVDTAGRALADATLARIGVGYEYVFIPGSRRFRPYVGGLVGLQRVSIDNYRTSEMTAYVVQQATGNGWFQPAPDYRLVAGSPMQLNQLLLDLTFGFRSELSAHLLLAAGARVGWGWTVSPGLPYWAPFVSLGGYL